MNKEKGSYFVLVVIIIGMVLAGCQSRPQGPQINIETPWGRPSPKIADAGAFYMIIRNTGSEPDKLIGGKSSACGMVELHESYLTAEGAMGMRPVQGGVIEVPAGGQAELKVGGLHIMCLKKLVDFTPGTKLQLALEFEKSGEKTVDVEIRQP